MEIAEQQTDMPIESVANRPENERGDVETRLVQLIQVFKLTSGDDRQHHWLCKSADINRH